MVRSALFAITVAAFLSACHKWVVVEQPDLVLQEQAEEPIDDRDVLRLHFDDSDASIEGRLQSLGPDSLVVANGSNQATVPRSAVSEVAVRRGDAAATFGVVLGSLVGSLLLLGIIVAATCDPDSFVC
jgi:hypothetical protein